MVCSTVNIFWNMWSDSIVSFLFFNPDSVAQNANTDDHMRL